MNELDNIIQLTDEKGMEQKFEFLDVVEYGEQEYIVLLPCDDEESVEVLILLLESEDDGRETYVGVEDEEVLNTVFGIFKERFKNDFNFLDE